jgi:hypothetical protein
MSKTKIYNILKKNNGYIFSKQLTEQRIPTVYLTRMVRKNELIRYAPGIYISPDYFPDDLFLIQQRYTKMIYSHETALFCLGLIDRNPLIYTVTIPYDYNVKELNSLGISVFYSNRTTIHLGITDFKTSQGNNIQIYNAERCLCDILRYKTKIDIQIITTAFQNYINKNIIKINLPLLNHYADIFGVSNQITERLSILL